MSGFDLLDTVPGRIQLLTAPPQTPDAYYGGALMVASDEWRGGEVFYHTGSGTGANKLYLQTATSGRTPTWKLIATQFETYP